jgi:hypothetical protein
LGYVFNNRFCFFSGFAEAIRAVIVAIDDNLAVFHFCQGFAEPPESLKLAA